MIKYKSIYIPQVDESDCGVACLAMILKKYHSRVSLARLRHDAKTNKKNLKYGITGEVSIITGKTTYFEYVKDKMLKK